MYGSFISATAKAAIIDPHPDGKFFVDLAGLGTGMEVMN